MFSQLKSIARHKLTEAQRKAYSQPAARFSRDMSFTEAMGRFPSSSEIYRYMHHYLHQLAPQELRDHRAYFSDARRGFGEDAFHAMWFLLLREFRPSDCLEIGIYRGQTISLWGLIAELCDFSCKLSGISPFSSAGDKTSVYMPKIDYWADTQASLARFSDLKANFLKAFSTDQNAKTFIAAHSWDMIYIDGNHDYDVALSDYQMCRDHLAPGGLLILDDSSLYSSYRPPLFAFPGHPGPSRVLRDFAMKELVFLGAVGHNSVLRKPL
ncbi:MAG TPA: class I SAM-dependent methyltransferase [Acidobacteriaceae bacterium]|nr:class I SAM-dependent methyltransferase [Acidobacteriaceae bacterium]